MHYDIVHLREGGWGGGTPCRRFRGVWSMYGSTCGVRDVLSDLRVFPISLAVLYYIIYLVLWSLVEIIVDGLDDE